MKSPLPFPRGNDPAVEISTVDKALRRGFLGSGFTPEIEALYVRHYLATRTRVLPAFAFLGTLMYLAAFSGDLAMLSHSGELVAWLRLTVFAPYIFGSVMYMQLRPSARAYDILTLGVGLLAISLPMLPFIGEEGPYLFIYQTGSLATLGFFVIVLRPRFPTVLLGLVAMTAIQLEAIRLNGSFDNIELGGITSFYLTLDVFLAMAAYFTERVDRQNFLHRLRGEALQKELKGLSETDALTGLLNRHAMEEFRRKTWTGTNKRLVSAIMLDIDNFKTFNDLYGHISGDSCIRQVARVVQDTVGNEGEVLRYGGEEIVVLLSGVTSERVIDLGISIRQAVETLNVPHRGSGHMIVTASLGIATVDSRNHTLNELLQRADTALYQAKNLGRNQVCSWTPSLDDQIFTGTLSR